MRSVRGSAVAIVAVISVMFSIGSAGASGITKVGQLRNAPIPASCRHHATTLDGFSKDFGQSKGQARLLTKKAVFGHLAGVRGSVAAVPLLCDAGGVTWPELILLYGAHRHLIGKVDLMNTRPKQEHADVTSLHFARHRVRVRWTSYEGAGFHVRREVGVIGWKHGHRTWSSHQR